MLRWTFLLSVICSNVFATGNNEDVYYRYINERGYKVLNDTLPPEFAQKGYDKVNQLGVVIETVPPAVSEEALTNKNSEAYKRRQQEIAQQRLKAWDQRLMLRYSSVDDIEDAKVRALREVKIRISILKSNLRQLLANVERDQATAANSERRGIEPSEELLQRIDVLKQEVKETELSIVNRNLEAQELEAEYEKDKKRFEKIMDQVKFRQEYYRMRRESQY